LICPAGAVPADHHHGDLPGLAITQYKVPLDQQHGVKLGCILALVLNAI
jgi:hypothetical protein